MEGNTNTTAPAAQPGANNSTEPNNQQGNASVQTGAEPSAKSFTQADIDSAVKKAVEDAQAQWKKDADEAARLSKLSKDDREKAEFEKKVEKYNADRAALDREKLVNETGKQLNSKKLPSDFAELLTGKDADATMSNINNFETAFSKAVEAAVTERLKGKTPGGGMGNSAKENDPFLAGFEKM